MNKVKYNCQEFIKLPLEERKKLYLKEKARRPNYIPLILVKDKKSTLAELSECR